MAVAWRLCQAPYADLSGAGARLHGGRWNNPGRPVLYLAADAALCVLEVRVHLDLPPELIPADYVLVAVEHDDVPIERVDRLPEDPRGFGDLWLEQQRGPLLSVPSTIVAESRNLLLNPGHPQAARARISRQRPFAFDERLWHPRAGSPG